MRRPLESSCEALESLRTHTFSLHCSLSASFSVTTLGFCIIQISHLNYKSIDKNFFKYTLRFNLETVFVTMKFTVWVNVQWVYLQTSQDKLGLGTLTL